MIVRVLYDMYGANMAGIMAHPQDQMRNLGISYYEAFPQSLFDAWVFWIDDRDDLPLYIRKLSWEPIGHV